MTGQDQAQRVEVPELESRFGRYFIDIASECPYGMEQLAVYHQGVFSRLDDLTMGRFFARGYRRNGNCLYNMRCPGCTLCVPIRLQPERFRLNRNQRRVWRKNHDVSVEIAPLTMSRENLALLQRFLSTRFPAGRSSAESYYTGFFITSISRCFEVRYLVDRCLLGVAVVDASPDWLNAVYFYFDPDQSWRSPGTLNILTLNHICKSQRIGHLYLGYWIDGLSGMSYKSAFRPHELFVDGTWQEQV
jgi:arginine-tRNA-protein transferase